MNPLDKTHDCDETSLASDEPTGIGFTETERDGNDVEEATPNNAANNIASAAESLFSDCCENDSVAIPESSLEQEPEQGPNQEAASERLDAIEAALAELARLFRTKIDRSEYELETLRKQSDEIQEYRADLYGKLTLPLLQGIVQVHAGMMKTVERFAHMEDDREGAVPISTVEVFCEELEDLLSDNGVERFSVAPGDAFVSGDMRIIGKVATTDEALIGTIAAAASDGYRLNGKSIAPARVKVHVAE